jgi:hypothetical protein
MGPQHGLALPYTLHVGRSNKTKKIIYDDFYQPDAHLLLKRVLYGDRDTGVPKMNIGHM